MEEKDLHEHEHHHEHEHEHEHHHHDEECECGCEHEHEHEHHHEHDHEHHHDHDHEHHHHDDGCECGCDHDHEEEECHDPNCTDPSHHHHHHHDESVEISHHESSVIGAMKGVMGTADYDEAEKLLAAQMREAGRLVTEAGGIIGHIKFVLTSAGRAGQISVTDVEENIRRFDGGTSTVEGVAIVFAVEDDKLREILEHTIGTLFVKEGE